MAASETFNCEIFIKTMVDGNFSWIRHSIKPNCDHDIPYISILHENQHGSLIINNVRIVEDLSQLLLSHTVSELLCDVRHSFVEFDLCLCASNTVNFLLAKEVIPKGFNLKWTLNLGSNGGGDNNIKNILNDTSEKLLKETLKVCE
jgi:hypothetical protein